MTTEQQLRARYADILEESDDAACLRVVRDLETAYPSLRPPSVLHARVTASCERYVGARKRQRLIRPAGPSTGRWRRKRVWFAALVIAAAAVGVGSSGLAAAAIETIRTHLFSAPPPSPQAAVWVGSLEPPLWGGCAPRPTGNPVAAPDGRRFAQLDSVPEGFAGSVAVTFPPCMPRPLPPGVVPPRQPANLAWENITIISVLRYQGPSGTLEVTTARATAQGMRRGLYLGNPAGTLADGSPAFTLTNDIRWLKDGLIVDLSGDAPFDRLTGIASGVILR